MSHGRNDGEDFYCTSLPWCVEALIVDLWKSSPSLDECLPCPAAPVVYCASATKSSTYFFASKCVATTNFPARLMEQENRAVARKPRDVAAVLFVLKFADNIHYKFKSSQASKATLKSTKHTGAKQNLTQNSHSWHSRSFKVTCFGVSGKAITD